LESLQLAKYRNVDANTFFNENNVGQKFQNEFIEALTRVNYGQNLNLNSLGALVSLAASSNDVRVVEGGNYQIFEQFSKASGATLKMETTVQSITKSSDGKWNLITSQETKEFDKVIIAAPFVSHLSIFFYYISISF